MSNEQNNWCVNKWKCDVTYPNNYINVKNLTDVQLVHFWRFLPPSKTYKEQSFLGAVCYEFNNRKRFGWKDKVVEEIHSM